MRLRSISILRTHVVFAAILGTFSASLSKGDPLRIVVNTADVYQEIDGFGACIVDYDTLPAYQDPEFYDRVVFDLGASILRLPAKLVFVDDRGRVGADATDLNELEKGAFGYGMEIAQQFQSRGLENVFATVWSPPAWMKTNHSVLLGGRLRPDLRNEFADGLSAFVRVAKEKYGVSIGAISLQNELLFVEPYDSCLYNPLQLRETLRIVQRRFKEDGDPARILLPEDMGWAERMALYVGPLMADKETRTFDGFFVSHGWNGFENWRKMAANLSPFGKRFWMTETSGQNPDWDGGLALAANMHDTLAGGNASAFIYWQFSSREASRAALMAAGEYTPKAYAAKHYFRFVRPGSHRVYAGGSNASVLASAYELPETKELTIVFINLDEEAISIDLQDTDHDSPLNYLTFTSSDGHYLEPGELDAGELLEIPARGMVTVYGRGGEVVTELPTLRPEGWSIPPLSNRLEKSSVKTIDERLHAAARADDIALLKDLLKEGLDPNALNVGQFSPLHRAAWPGHVDVIGPLLSAGADPNRRGGGGETPLHIAAGKGNESFLRSLVEAGADINQQDDNGQTPIDRAALGGRIDTVVLLLENGANPNLADENGWTALHWAAASSSALSVKVMQALLEAGANPQILGVEGESALHVAAANCVSPKIARGMDDGVGILVNVERLRVLVEAGASVNGKDSRGRTPLHWVAWMGETQYGEDVDLRPFFRYLTEAVRFLLVHGADPGVKDLEGCSPADLAAREGYSETVSLLKNVVERPWLVGAAAEAGSKPAKSTGVSSKKSSAVVDRALLDAAAAGDLQGVVELLGEGANPNQLGSQGGGPLHSAVNGHFREIVGVLLKAGADPYLRDSDGYSPLDRARQNGQKDLVDILSEHL